MSTLYSFKKIFLLCALFLIIIIPYQSNANQKNLTGGGPIVITSSTLSADNKARTALFEGSVVAKTDDMTLYSNRMTVFYSEDGRVTTVKAEGSVKLIRGERVVTAGKAVYLADEQKIIFTDNPKAVEGNNVITGSKMIYLIKDDRSIVEDSKVFLKQPEGK
jgi:lipopolysaccharide export system protein LptA